MKHIGVSNSSSFTVFKGATYSTSIGMIKFNIEISSTKWSFSDLGRISKSMSLYTSCFDNPYVTGCELPKRTCPTNQTQHEDHIVLEEENDKLSLDCIHANSPSSFRNQRGFSTFPNCCPRDKNIICHGCSGTKDKNVKVTLCPKGFTCFGKISPRTGTQDAVTTMTKTKSIKINFQSKLLLYRPRRSSETNNTEQELINLYHLKIIQKSFDTIANQFLNFNI